MQVTGMPPSEVRFKELYTEYSAFMHEQGEDPVSFDEFIDLALDLMRQFIKFGKAIL